MCGIAGIICVSRNNQLDLGNEIKKMTDSLIHRGPDGEGHWLDPSGMVALGHRRLAILDLSAKGSQPMVSSSGRYVIVLNGEIYNYRLLKDELEALGYRFTSTSDTEVLLEAVEKWGIAGALEKAAGMFAVAVFDNLSRRLYLARDRIGEKPLYYGRAGSCFIFASELKALKALSFFKGRIDRDALALFLRHNYIAAPFSIYEDIYKLEPGTFLEIDVSNDQEKIRQIEYWSLKSVVESGQKNLYSASSAEILKDFDALLRMVVQEQMIADVPVGAFLSGGIDSSLIVAIMQAISKTKVKTFTIGFEEEEFNEAKQAGALAGHLGTDHSELYIGPEDLLNLVPDIPYFYDEPFADSSQIPTCLVAKLAGDKVKVVLSGDGGDEFFGGYNPYIVNQKIWAGIKKMPHPLRRLGAGLVNGFSSSSLEGMLKLMGKLSGKELWLNGERIKKLGELLPVTSRELLYKNLISKWKLPDRVVLNAKEPETIFTIPVMWPEAELSYPEWMMYIDQMSYLPGNNLVKVDRASMAASLETRVPLLDHRVIEYAWQLPLSYKINGDQKKWILKKLLEQYIPKELTDRPKKGFGVPVEQWLRGPLKDWAGDLLSETRIKREGYFDFMAINKRWTEHIKEERNWDNSLWGVLMFHAWLDLI